MLGSLPKTLEESYDVVYCQLIDLDEETRIIAENAIRWLLCSKRQLLSSELIAALSINESEGSPTDEDEEVMDADELLDLCCNLIVLDKSLDTFRMAHLSVREYFEKKAGYEHVTIHTMATSACLNSLTASSMLDYGTPLVPFQSYATIFWLNHCSEIGPEGPTGQLKSVAKLFLFEGCEASPLFVRWASTVHAVPKDSKSFTLLNEEEWRKLHDAASIPPHPLFLAGSFGFVWVLEELFNYMEFDFDRKRDNGHCCAIVAASWGHNRVVEWLLRHGTDVNVRGEGNRTPLNLACMYGHKQVVEFLIAHGADVDARIDVGWTPLHEAVWHSNYDSVLLILQAGGDIDAQQSLGWTPLIMAAQNKREDVAKLLLMYNPDFTIQNNKGFTAMHHADARVIRLLLAQGAKLSDPVYKTVLISQTNASRVDAVLLLIEEGFDLNFQDENNKAAIDHAIETGVPEVLDILVTHKARPGLQWDVNSHHIAQWKEETWFPQLLDILSSSNTTVPAPFVPMSGSNHHVSSDSEVIITMDSPDVPYLWIRVPAEMTSVTRIKFTTESHDQGVFCVLLFELKEIN
jgi:ankyrin repeat protein